MTIATTIVTHDRLAGGGEAVDWLEEANTGAETAGPIRIGIAPLARDSSALPAPIDFARAGSVTNSHLALAPSSIREPSLSLTGLVTGRPLTRGCAARGNGVK